MHLLGAFDLGVDLVRRMIESSQMTLQNMNTYHETLHCPRKTRYLGLDNIRAIFVENELGEKADGGQFGQLQLDSC